METVSALVMGISTLLAVPEMEWQGIVIQTAGNAVSLQQIGIIKISLSIDKNRNGVTFIP